MFCFSFSNRNQKPCHRWWNNLKSEGDMGHFRLQCSAVPSDLSHCERWPCWGSGKNGLYGFCEWLHKLEKFVDELLKHNFSLYDSLVAISKRLIFDVTVKLRFKVLIV